MQVARHANGTGASNCSICIGCLHGSMNTNHIDIHVTRAWPERFLVESRCRMQESCVPHANEEYIKHSVLMG